MAQTTKKSPPKKKPTKSKGKVDANEFFRRLSVARPNPRTELDYVNPYTLLVAVVLSAQATDVGVNKATKELFKKIDAPEKMLKLGLDGLREYVKTIGLYKGKSENIIKLSQLLIDNHNSQVPDDRAALEALPGVGRKTANVVLNEIFGHPTLAVDTHVFRVANRTGLAVGDTPLKVEEGLLQVVPEKYGVGAHHWLILHGRYVCVARKPKCPACVVADLCQFADKTQEAE